MRTNIVLNDDLLEQAFKCAGNVHTKKELVETALEEFVKNRKTMDLRDLRGKIHFSSGYSHKKMRMER